jgi:hypothetical protein
LKTQHPQQIHGKIAFTYNKRSVVAYEPEKDGYRIIVFRDESMRSKEMSDFIGRRLGNGRIHEEG